MRSQIIALAAALLTLSLAGCKLAERPRPPVLFIADAGDDTFGYESRGKDVYVVRLDGSASVNAVTYHWEQIAGEEVVLRNADTATPDFDASQDEDCWCVELPRSAARLRFRLTINRDTPDEASDEVEVYIRLPGDANGDDVVNVYDVERVRSLDPSADFNGDGVVDARDALILRTNACRRRWRE